MSEKPLDNPEEYLSARKVWERYGVCDMTLSRWLNNADMKFPRPIRIGRQRRYWRTADLIRWERSLAKKAAA